MAEQSTFIKLDRNILRWRWWQKSKTLHVFLFLLLNANIADHEFENDMIHRGEVVTSLGSIVKSTGLTIREVRTAISTLKKTGEVTSRANNRYRVITIVNYDRYQEVRQAESQSNGQSSDKQATSKRQQYKNNKNIKNEKNIPPKPPRGGQSPSGEQKKEPGREEGGYEDIPLKHRDGTYHNFATYADYWDWRNQ